MITSPSIRFAIDRLGRRPDPRLTRREEPSKRPSLPKLLNSAAPPVPGQLIAERYRIKELLGEGGMSQVYLAHDTERGIDLALKIALAGQESTLLAEGRTMEALYSSETEPPPPSLVHLYELGIHNLIPYLALGHIEGRTLGGEIRQRGKIDLPRALEITASICFGLRYAAQKGLVHKDLKPENVMIRKSDGQAVLLDFGLSGRTPAPGTAIGTIPFMSPEQARGEELDLRSDIYSLGIMLYEMVNGRVRTPGTDLDMVLAQRARGDSHISNVDINDPLQRLIWQMTAPEKEDRPQNYDELLAQIEAVKAEIRELAQSWEALQAQVPDGGPPEDLTLEDLTLVAAHRPTLRDEFPLGEAFAPTLGPGLPLAF